jgi:large subunit ribosomal protein L10
MKKLGLLFKEISENRIKNNLKESNSVFIVKYSGLSSPALTHLRQSLKNSNASLFVVKNSIARRALKNSGLEPFIEAIEGPCGLIFVKEEPVNASRVLYDFSRDHEQLRLEGGILKDEILTRVDIERLSRLPTKEILRIQVILALKSPMASLAIVLNQVLRKFIYCLEQVKNKKGGANG